MQIERKWERYIVVKHDAEQTVLEEILGEMYQHGNETITLKKVCDTYWQVHHQQGEKENTYDMCNNNAYLQAYDMALKLMSTV